VSLHGEIKLTNGRRDKALKNEEEKKWRKSELQYCILWNYLDFFFVSPMFYFNLKDFIGVGYGKWIGKQRI
jgi:hypothetical protein